jgi:hypothetical protein
LRATTEERQSAVTVANDATRRFIIEFLFSHS